MRSQDRNDAYRWFGSPVSETEGTIEEIRQRLPTFRSRTLGVPSPQEEAERSIINPRLNIILREPLAEDGEEVPVGVVSKKYRLIQHRAVLEAAEHALRECEVNPDGITAQLRITAFGERMGFNLLFPDDDRYNLGLNGGEDGMRLRLQCFNSVDRSTRFMVFLGWFRFVCSNGLVMGVTELDIRRRHVGGLKIEDIGAVLAQGLSAVEGEKRQYAEWVNKKVGQDRLQGWIDGFLRKQWGVKLAARAFHIVRTGRDGAFATEFQKGKPSEKTMVPRGVVPGITAPVGNAFGVSQVLSWLAKERRNIEEQVGRMREIPVLMRELLSREKD